MFMMHLLTRWISARVCVLCTERRPIDLRVNDLMLVRAVAVCRCILSTDMAKHNDILKAFRAVTQSIDITAKDQKELVSCSLVLLLLC